MNANAWIGRWIKRICERFVSKLVRSIFIGLFDEKLNLNDTDWMSCSYVFRLASQIIEAPIESYCMEMLAEKCRIQRRNVNQPWKSNSKIFQTFVTPPHSTGCTCYNINFREWIEMDEFIQYFSATVILFVWNDTIMNENDQWIISWLWYFHAQKIEWIQFLTKLSDQ